MRGRLHIIFIFCILAASCRESNNDRLHHTGADTVKVITASPAEVVASSQRTVKPKMLGTTSQVILNGVIAADERRNNKVSVKVGGRIEKLYAKFNYQYIKAGTAVIDIYSPELNTAAEEYLLLYKGDTDRTLLENGRKKLKLMGLTEAQINNIEKAGKAPRTFTVYSGYNGYVFQGDIQFKEGDTSSETNMEMGEMSNDAEPLEESFAATVIREGAYVNKGQTLFTVNDIEQVWAMITVPPGINMNKGDSIRISTGQGTFTETIDFIEPFFQQGQKFSRARIYLDNSKGGYKLNDLLTAELSHRSKDTVLAVPRKSVLDLGQRKIVWVKTGTVGANNLFNVREVTTGQNIDGFVQILSGLQEGEEIAEVAGFMVDSESLIEK